jgi:nucleoside 2-deoxyribosyltransferase
MKIYFSGSVTSAKGDIRAYQKIIEFLKTKGEVLSEFIADKKLVKKEIKQGVTDEQIYGHGVELIGSCDLFVAEVTNRSLGVGYEIAHAENRGKRIICLFNERKGKKLSPMLKGNDNISVVKYSDIDELKDKFNQELGNFKESYILSQKDLRSI